MSDEDEGWSDWMIWCDMHEAFHDNEPIQDPEESPACGPDSWRRVFIEPRWYKAAVPNERGSDD